jgi:hypothetical protein
VKSLARLKMGTLMFAWAFAFASWALDRSPPLGERSAARSQDAGTRATFAADQEALDREIEENLELLERLDETADLDLLLELSRGD